MSICTACHGSGEITTRSGETITCPNCNGTGKAPVDPRD